MKFGLAGRTLEGATLSSLDAALPKDGGRESRRIILPHLVSEPTVLLVHFIKEVAVALEAHVIDQTFLYSIVMTALFQHRRKCKMLY